MKRVHLRGVPCGSGRRWSSCVMTSTGDPAKVTCRKCLAQSRPSGTLKNTAAPDKA